MLLFAHFSHAARRQFTDTLIFKQIGARKKSTFVAIATSCFGEIAETLLRLGMNLSPP